jgi:hypothetical protein
MVTILRPFMSMPEEGDENTMEEPDGRGGRLVVASGGRLVAEPPPLPADLAAEAADLAAEAAFVSAIIHHAEPDALPHILRPIAALSELVAVCVSVDEGRELPGQRDRRSLGADLRLALSKVGPELESELQPALRDFQHDILADLATLLEDGGGRQRASGIARALVAAFKSPASAQAAWRDLVEGARRGLHHEECLLRALAVREICEALGHEWLWLGRELDAQALAGEFAEAEEALAALPARTAEAAWFVFAHADVRDGYLRVGQVQFFSHRLWPDAVRDRSFLAKHSGSVFPAELDDDAININLKVSAEIEHLVFARVELTGPNASGQRNPWAQGQPPLEWARALVTSIVDAATFRRGGSAWLLLEGGMLYHSFDDWGGTAPFTDPDLMPDVRRLRPLYEGTGEALEDLPTRFAELVAEGNESARDTLTEVRWFQAAAKQPDAAQRLALLVRGFERALPIPPGERWYDAVKYYFRDFWALSRFDDELFRLVHEADVSLRRSSADRPEGFERMITREGIRSTVTLPEILRQAVILEQAFPVQLRLERRRARELIKWASDPAAASARIAEQAQRFDMLLRRALRQRNAVLHGIKTVPAAVLSVDSFVTWLAGSLVAQDIQRIPTGEALGDSLESGRVVERRRIWRLAQGHPTDEALYGP